MIGVDVQPGTYRSSGQGYWARLSCATGDFSCILSNNNASGQEYVTLLNSDSYFETSSMDRWVPESSLSSSNATTFSGSGMYKVNFDIEPGTYQSSGGGYWARLSCATGNFRCILANGNPDGNAYVTIRSTDSYFTTSLNGTWTKIN
jgi:hypothetical protein